MKKHLILPLLTMLLTLTGCATTGRQQSETRSELQFLAIAAHNYMTASHGNIPTDFDAVMVFLDGFNDSDKYQIVATGNIRDYPDTSTAVLVQEAYPSSKDGSRLAAFLDGHVGTIPAR